MPVKFPINEPLNEPEDSVRLLLIKDIELKTVKPESILSINLIVFGNTFNSVV